MKIIQIVAGQEDGDHCLYGLGDDGTVYELHHEMNPLVRYHAPDGAVCLPTTPGARAVFRDGITTGWVPVVRSDQRSRPVPHIDDPTRHERS